MHHFTASLEIIGVNPFVFVPPEILQEIFDALPASRRKEIVRYIANLKTEESVERNVSRAIGFLLGKERFIGRDKP
ncbi:MAG: YdeI/OmpD-associated family protein [Saprospiraceae bacterium]|nr:YdeI/OmpD-associated family protein [Saprospiraceae bacterium]